MSTDRNAWPRARRLWREYRGVLGFLLLMITFGPFPTAVLARYIDTRFIQVAVMFYAGYSVLTSLAFSTWVEAMNRPVHLIRPAIGRQNYAKLRARTWWGVIVYLLTALVSWRLPVVGLVMISALWIVWAMFSIGGTNPSRG